MIEFLSILLSVFVFIAIIAFSKWRKLSQENELRELVSWSAIGDYSPALGRYSYNRALIIAVLNAQYRDSIDQKCRITEDTDKQYLCEIIEEYQKDITRSYFKGHLKLIKSKYVIPGNTYFMLMLYAFLSDHQCDYEFLGHKMHEKQISYKSYGESFSAGFDATYALSDFAIVFHKMHYITYMYCKEDERLKSFVPEWNEKNLKEILDTKQIQLSRGY